MQQGAQAPATVNHDDFHPTTTRRFCYGANLQYSTCSVCVNNRGFPFPPSQAELWACSKHPEAAIKVCETCKTDSSCDNYCCWAAANWTPDGTPSRWHEILHEENQSFLWFLKTQQDAQDNINFLLHRTRLLDRGGHAVEIMFCVVFIGGVSTLASTQLLACCTDELYLDAVQEQSKITPTSPGTIRASRVNDAIENGTVCQLMVATKEFEVLDKYEHVKREYKFTISSPQDYNKQKQAIDMEAYRG